MEQTKKQKLFVIIKFAKTKNEKCKVQYFDTG